MKRDAIFTWLRLGRLRSLLGSETVQVENKMRYDEFMTFDNDHDIPDVATVKNLVEEGGNATEISYTEANLVPSNPGMTGTSYYLIISALPTDKIILLPPIVDKSGITTRPLNIQISDDYLYMIGFPDNDPQTITIKII